LTLSFVSLKFASNKALMTGIKRSLIPAVGISRRYGIPDTLMLMTFLTAASFEQLSGQLPIVFLSLSFYH